MDIDKICILISSLSFFAYAVSFFTSQHMKKEFKRFGLEKIGLLGVEPYFRKHPHIRNILL